MYLLELKTLEIFTFGIAVFFFAWASYINYKESSITSFFLFAGAFFLGIFYSSLDPFLNLWDEQFHALVAKNLSNDFLTPKLHNNSSLSLDYKDWTNNEIWLHKQPLFLWQMALSIKIFGTTTFAVRFPSVLMHSLIPFFVYKIGVIIFNKKVAFYGALIFAVASYPLELLVGKYATDHNDIAFLFYTTASFWAWFEYQKKKNLRWVILIGVFSGCAVLVKWLMGLLAFIIWGVIKVITDKRQLFILGSYKPIFFSFIISVIIFLPWQIYILQAFPVEAYHEFTYNSRHLYEVIEGHDGDWSFHFLKGLKKLYGDSNLMLLILALSVMLTIIKLKNIKFKLFIVLLFSFVYLFFSLVQTKMISYPIVVFPFVCLAVGFLIYFIVEQFSFIRFKPFIATSIVVLVCLTSFNFDILYHNHIKNRNSNQENLIGEFKELKMIELLQNHLKEEDYILFNNAITPYGYIPTMFYTDYESYGVIPSKKQIKLLKERGIKIACLHTKDLPAYILEDKSIKLIPIPTLEQ